MTLKELVSKLDISIVLYVIMVGKQQTFICEEQRF